MKTVQVAIQDPVYADSLCSLLLQDGHHRVYVVEKPDLTLTGVIVTEAAALGHLPLLRNERERLIIVAHKEHDDLSKIWDAGVRHVLFHGDPPNTTRMAFLGLELSLGPCRRKPS